MANPWLAWTRQTDPDHLSRELRDAHARFVADGHTSDAVRNVVAKSWQRSRRSGVDPDRSAPLPAELSAEELRAYREGHPLSAVRHIVTRLLVESAGEAGHVVAMTDAGGRLLWVEGDRTLRSRVAEMGFVDGALWSEDTVGTNAPGTALRVDHSLAIFSHEHFSRSVQPWSCSAAPIHDPRTGSLLGALDVTGDDLAASPQSLALVDAAVLAIESHLLLLPPLDQPGFGQQVPWRLDVLGRDTAALHTPLGTISLSGRHAEILLVLHTHPAGISADELTGELASQGLSPVTVRAEIARLRRLVGNDVIASKPYRLQVRLETDVDAVLADVRRGAIRKAADSYSGPVLPQSDAPGVRRLRDDATAELRQALLRHGSPDPLLQYVETSDGRHDEEILEAALRVLPYGSPRRPDMRVLLDEARRPAS